MKDTCARIHLCSQNLVGKDNRNKISGLMGFFVLLGLDPVLELVS